MFAALGGEVIANMIAGTASARDPVLAVALILNIALILIGMPGLEKRLARYPQLYSRIGFAHAFRPLSTDEALFVLQQQWRAWGAGWSEEEFTDREAHAAILRITGGNFRLIDRLMAQIARIKRLNALNTVTKEVVEAARECLVIGST